jgi:hypothetical protein
MAHCPPELLTDLGALLAQVRTWPGVSETRPGIFYLRRAPFLHFHLFPGPRRRADVKGPAGWVQVELPAKMTERRRRALSRTLRRCYAERLKPARRAPALLSLARRA